jgi:hypothetical protein
MIGAITAGLFAGGVPAVTNSYESIATFTGSGTPTSITFSSIPSTYKHLQLRVFANVSSIDYSHVRFNGDTGSNYFAHDLFGNGSSAGAQAFTGQNNIVGTYTPSTASTYSAAVFDILDYQNTNKNKTVRFLSGYDANGSGYVFFGSGAWNNTAAINSLTYYMDSATFAANSSFALYGIKG